MNARAGLVVIAALLAMRGLAIAGPATADWAGMIRSLSADGVIQGIPPGKLSRSEMALLTARALATVEVTGASKDDEARVAALSNEFHNELDVLGVRDQNVPQARAALARRTQAAQTLGLSGEFSAASDRGASLEVVAPESAHLQNFALQAGALAAHPNSIAGLALGRQSPLAPVLRGVSVAGTVGGLSDFYFSVARMDRDLSYAPAVIGAPAAAQNSFALAPQDSGLVEFGPRDVVTGRFAQHLRYAPDAGIGVTYNHFFGSAGGGNLVSNTVFGLDLSVPLLARSGLRPAVYAEAASSATGVANVAFAPVSRFDNALVAGIKFHLRSVSASVQYQTVGANFVDGPRVSGSFFGAGTSVLSPQLPAQNVAPRDAGLATFTTSGYPAFNPFEDAAPASFSGYVPNTQGLKIDLSAPVRIGAATVQGNFSAARLQELAPVTFGAAGSSRATDDRLSAGTTFGIRALGRPIALNLGGSYEHILRNDATASTYLPYDPQAQGPDPGQIVAAPPGLTPVAFNPNVVDVTRRSLGAAAAVPLTRNLRLNLQYNAQFYSGSYTALGQTIDGRKDFYLGNLTYAIPRTSSAITFSAKQFRYRDSLLPTANLTQNRADLNFTVKF